MRGEGSVTESANDWFGGEVNTGDFFCNNTKSFGATKWDFNNSARSKLEIGRIGQKTRVFTKNPCWDHLIIHRYIISRSNCCKKYTDCAIIELRKRGIYVRCFYHIKGKEKNPGCFC